MGLKNEKKVFFLYRGRFGPEHKKNTFFTTEKIILPDFCFVKEKIKKKRFLFRYVFSLFGNAVFRRAAFFRSGPRAAAFSAR